MLFLEKVPLVIGANEYLGLESSTKLLQLKVTLKNVNAASLEKLNTKT